jgi:hypothetical protein
MTESEPGRDEDDKPREPATPQAGVLGNLPRTRPAVRSPRRKEAPDPAADAARAAAASRPPAAARRDEPAAAPTEGAPGELESLARTGIAVASGAASLGLRIAGRAAGAVRDAVERR